jgi:hypothetical protein
MPTERSDMKIEQAIAELKMEIPDAGGQEKYGTPCVILSEATAKLALDILERVQVETQYGILYGDEQEVWYSGFGEPGLALTKRRRSHEHGDKIYQRSRLLVAEGKKYGEWEEMA